MYIKREQSGVFRQQTCMFLWTTDKEFCKKQGLKLAYVFAKGLEFIKNPENTETLKKEFERRISFLNGKVDELRALLEAKGGDIRGLE